LFEQQSVFFFLIFTYLTEEEMIANYTGPEIFENNRDNFLINFSIIGLKYINIFNYFN
jgi:hypothetical protein